MSSFSQDRIDLLNELLAVTYKYDLESDGLADAIAMFLVAISYRTSCPNSFFDLMQASFENMSEDFCEFVDKPSPNSAEGLN